MGCTSLETVDAQSLRLIGLNAFAGDTALKSVTAPNLKDIGLYAFYECTSLTKFIFPASMFEIESSAFKNCVNLKTLVFDGNTLPIIGSQAFDIDDVGNITAYTKNNQKINAKAFNNGLTITYKDRLLAPTSIAPALTPGPVVPDHTPDVTPVRSGGSGTAVIAAVAVIVILLVLVFAVLPKVIPGFTLNEKLLQLMKPKSK